MSVGATVWGQATKYWKRVYKVNREITYNRDTGLLETTPNFPIPLILGNTNVA